MRTPVAALQATNVKQAKQLLKRFARLIELTSRPIKKMAMVLSSAEDHLETGFTSNGIVSSPVAFSTSMQWPALDVGMITSFSILDDDDDSTTSSSSSSWSQNEALAAARRKNPGPILDLTKLEKQEQPPPQEEEPPLNLDSLNPENNDKDTEDTEDTEDNDLTDDELDEIEVLDDEEEVPEDSPESEYDPEQDGPLDDLEEQKSEEQEEDEDDDDDDDGEELADLDQILHEVNKALQETPMPDKQEQDALEDPKPARPTNQNNPVVTSPPLVPTFTRTPVRRPSDAPEIGPNSINIGGGGSGPQSGKPFTLPDVPTLVRPSAPAGPAPSSLLPVNRSGLTYQAPTPTAPDRRTNQINLTNPKIVDREVGPDKIKLDLTKSLFHPDKEKALLQNWSVLRSLYDHLNTLQLTKNQWERQFGLDPEYRVLMSEINTMISGTKAKIQTAQKIARDIDADQVPRPLRTLVDTVSNRLRDAWSATDVSTTYFYLVLEVPDDGKSIREKGSKGLPKELQEILINKVYKKVPQPQTDDQGSAAAGKGAKANTRREVFFVGIASFRNVLAKTAELIDEYHVVISVHIPTLTPEQEARYSVQKGQKGGGKLTTMPSAPIKDIWFIKTAFRLKTINDLFDGAEFSGNPEKAWDMISDLIEVDLMPPPNRLTINDLHIETERGERMSLTDALVKDPSMQANLALDDPDSPGQKLPFKIKEAIITDNSLYIVPETPIEQTDNRKIFSIINRLAYIINTARTSLRTGQITQVSRDIRQRVVGTWVKMDYTQNGQVFQTVAIKIWLAPLLKSGQWTADQVALVSDMLKLSEDQEYQLRAYLL
jgi:hypothetical protein